MGDQLPPHFQRLKGDSYRAVVRDDLLDDLTAALSEKKLYDFARSVAGARSHAGRADAWSFRMPRSGQAVLVRRSRHGGLLAPLTREFFTGEGRAPHELMASIELQKRGIRTPQILAYVVYPAAGIFSKIDVMVQFLEGTRDLASVLATSDAESSRAGMLAASALIAEMNRQRVVHPDLNLRNILIELNGKASVAWLLDVDRVHFDQGSEAATGNANLRRFGRSLHKLIRLGVIKPTGGDSQQFLTARATRIVR